ncbi:MerR family transcriptional regulator [Alicyclobacillus kakegawensis]|uniref:MerR family transcriptional regulator n=1 Tax=Alicyclobacillus kakegawensis TaxID=392012 RepID=UPI000A79B668|nr:MerR family transcriptional regulator [Alicyclobacillus kakegawensis]
MTLTAGHGGVAMDLKDRMRQPLFSIGVVQQLTGLTARQIRYYEQQGLVSPGRTEGNRRLFSFVDVERLVHIRSLLDEGMTLSDVRNFLAAEAKQKRRGQSVREEATDQQVYRWVERELLGEGKGPSQSVLQGDLSRFYRRRP